MKQGHQPKQTLLGEMRKQMAGFRNFVIGCALSVASIMTPVASAQAVPLAVPDVKIDRLTRMSSIRRDYGGYGTYRDHRPYYGGRIAAISPTTATRPATGLTTGPMSASMSRRGRTTAIAMSAVVMAFACGLVPGAVSLLRSGNQPVPELWRRLQDLLFALSLRTFPSDRRRGFPRRFH